MARNCPDCKEPMTTEKYRNVELDLCGECAGIWFDAEELRRLLAADPLAIAALEEKVLPHVTQKHVRQGILLCPSCEGLLHVYHYEYNSPIEMESCADCGGFWVQEGELLKIQQWRDAHHHATTEEEHKLIVAQATIEHENALHRLTNLHWLLGILRQHHPLWIG